MWLQGPSSPALLCMIYPSDLAVLRAHRAWSASLEFSQRGFQNGQYPLPLKEVSLPSPRPRALDLSFPKPFPWPHFLLPAVGRLKRETHREAPRPLPQSQRSGRRGKSRGAAVPRSAQTSVLPPRALQPQCPPGPPLCGHTPWARRRPLLAASRCHAGRCARPHPL